MSPDVELHWASLAAVPSAAGLSDAERSRAARARPVVARRRLARRAALRRVLAAELGCSPREVPLVDRPGQAPTLAGGGDGPRFSVASCADDAVVAVSWSMLVGVDAERDDRVALVEDLGFLTSEERRRLDEIPAAERPLAALRCWVAKEALLKAAGVGLAGEPASVEVGFGPVARGSRWVVRAESAPEGVMCAVATIAATPPSRRST